jgi:hypothetical protein
MFLKIIKTIPLILGLICFSVTGYVYSMLSYIDYPYVDLGILLIGVSVYLLKKK